MSIQRSGSADGALEACLDAVQDVAGSSENGPFVSVISGGYLATLAIVAGLDAHELDRLAQEWAKTEEFEDWEFADVRDLLRSIGELAESASLQGKSAMLWVSL